MTWDRAILILKVTILVCIPALVFLLLAGCAKEHYYPACPPPLLPNEAPFPWVPCDGEASQCVYERTFKRAFDVQQQILFDCYVAPALPPGHAH